MAVINVKYFIHLLNTATKFGNRQKVLRRECYVLDEINQTTKTESGLGAHDVSIITVAKVCPFWSWLSWHRRFLPHWRLRKSRAWQESSCSNGGLLPAHSFKCFAVLTVSSHLYSSFWDVICIKRFWNISLSSRVFACIRLCLTGELLEN